MKSLSAAELSALAARSLAFRNLVWITAKNRTTGALTPFGFWDDVGTRALQVIDVLTGATVTRNFVGAGSLLQIDDVVATSELQVRELVIRLSGVDATVANAVRGSPRPGRASSASSTRSRSMTRRAAARAM
jgi:hypothetical protein